ncbi:MAG: TolC family protein [Rikenellaceae bacterium]
MKQLILICAVLMTTSSVMAQDSTLLQKYRAMALQYNHDLKAVQKNINISMELEKSAKADKKPKAAGGINYQFTGNPMEINMPPIDVQGSHNQYGAFVSLLQPVYTGGRILETIRLAQIRQSYTKNQAEFLRSSVCFQTDIQYWNTVARKEMIAVTQAYRNSVQSLVNIIRERVEVGMTDPTDLLMAEVKLNEADYQLMQITNSFETGLMALNSIIGVDLPQQTAVDEAIPLILPSDYESLRYTNIRPEVKMAQDQISMEKSNLKLTDSKYKPQFYVGADGNYSSPGYNFKPNMDPNYALYGKISIPIFEWGKRRSDKRASNFRIGMATDNLNKVDDEVKLEIGSTKVALDQAIERTKLTENSLAKAKENETKMLERYSEGKVSITEVINAQLYYQTSLINFVQSKLEGQSQLSKLKNVLNIE